MKQLYTATLTPLLSHANIFISRINIMNVITPSLQYYALKPNRINTKFWTPGFSKMQPVSCRQNWPPGLLEWKITRWNGINKLHQHPGCPNTSHPSLVRSITIHFPVPNLMQSFMHKVFLIQFYTLNTHASQKLII